MFTYEISSSQSWIYQDAINARKFSIEVNDEPSLLGEHSLTVLVSSTSYAAYIYP